jgi:hypothetical protein
MWRCVDLVWTDALEERIAPIFNVEESANEEPWRWRRYVPPTRRFTQGLKSATSQNTAFFIVTAVKPQILHSIVSSLVNNPQSLATAEDEMDRASSSNGREEECM